MSEQKKDIWSGGNWWRAPRAIFQLWPTLGFYDGKGVWRALTSTDLSVYLCLYYHADHNMTCFPSYATIARETATHRNTVVAAVRHLEKAMLIRKERRRGHSKRYASNLYTILPLRFVSIDGTPDVHGDGSPGVLGGSPDVQERESYNENHKEEEHPSSSVLKKEEKEKARLLSQYGMRSPWKQIIRAAETLPDKDVPCDSAWLKAAAAGVKEEDLPGTIVNRFKGGWLPDEDFLAFLVNYYREEDQEKDLSARDAAVVLRDIDRWLSQQNDQAKRKFGEVMVMALKYSNWWPGEDRPERWTQVPPKCFTSYALRELPENDAERWRYCKVMSLWRRAGGDLSHLWEQCADLVQLDLTKSCHELERNG